MTYGAPFTQGDPLDAEILNDRLETGAGNLVANPRFSAVRYVDASNSTFPWWTTTGVADSVEGKLVLAAGEYAEQDLFDALGTNGWDGLDLVLGAILKVTDAAGEATLSIEWDTGEVQSIAATQAQLPDTYGTAWRAVTGPAAATSAVVKIENTGTAGNVECYLMHLGPGKVWRTPAHPAAAEPVAWLGVLTGTTVTQRGGVRMMRVEDIRITAGAVSSSASATVGLTAVGPAGQFVSGDVAYAAVSLDGTTGITRRTSIVAGTVSGTTLTVTAVAHRGLTYGAGTLVATAIVFVTPAAASVGSRGASKRAYPYG